MFEQYFFLSVIIIMQQLLLGVRSLKIVLADQRKDDQQSKSCGGASNSDNQSSKMWTQLSPRNHHYYDPEDEKVCRMKLKIFNGKKRREIRRDGYKRCAERCWAKDASSIPFCHRIRILRVVKCDCYPLDHLPFRLRFKLWWLNIKNLGVTSFIDPKHAGPTTLEILRRHNEWVIEKRARRRAERAQREHQQMYNTGNTVNSV